MVLTRAMRAAKVIEESRKEQMRYDEATGEKIETGMKRKRVSPPLSYTEEKRGRISIELRQECDWEAVYSTDQFAYLYSQEESSLFDVLPSPNHSRAILVDWLIEVHFTFQLEEATLYLALTLLNDYFKKETTRKDELQLIGITALFIAAKYEEVNPPDLQDCVYVTDQTYTEIEVLEMEKKILHTLNWRLSKPTAYPWILRLLQNHSKKIQCIAHFYAQSLLLNLFLSGSNQQDLMHKPSLLAAVAVYKALEYDHTAWDFKFSTLSGGAYSAEQLAQIHIPHVPIDLNAIVTKFSHVSYYHVYSSTQQQQQPTLTPLQRTTTNVVTASQTASQASGDHPFSAF
uniref:Cyclin-like domain-containing protein n=1 Tax=Aureoumbra lagunensis TaxID=44058 RepID=A0A7S3NPB6_9STRA|mmetsp:Transcript_15828/g.23809  ORF Transcript_15828/g.23809 Transcript_15828/m.23809 type:complete len:344 (-) Transcript_15828:338-1369(-)